MILKFDTLLRKSDARGAYGLRRCCWERPLTPSTPFEGMPFMLVVDISFLLSYAMVDTLLKEDTPEAPLLCGELWLRGK